MTDYSLNVLEHKTVTCRGGEYNRCQDCEQHIPDGQTKHLWRMYLKNNNSWHRGSFWTKHCDSCYKASLSTWVDVLAREIDSFQ